MIGVALSGQLGGATLERCPHSASAAAAAACAVVQVGPYLRALQPFASLSHLALLALAGGRYSRGLTQLRLRQLGQQLLRGPMCQWTAIITLSCHKTSRLRKHLSLLLRKPALWWQALLCEVQA